MTAATFREIAADYRDQAIVGRCFGHDDWHEAARLAGKLLALADTQAQREAHRAAWRGALDAGAAMFTTPGDGVGSPPATSNCREGGTGHLSTDGDDHE